MLEAHLVTTSKNDLFDCLNGKFYRFFNVGPWHPILVAFFFFLFQNQLQPYTASFRERKNYIKHSVTIDILNLLVYLGWQYSAPKEVCS